MKDLEKFTLKNEQQIRTETEHNYDSFCKKENLENINAFVRNNSQNSDIRLDTKNNRFHKESKTFTASPKTTNLKTKSSTEGYNNVLNNAQRVCVRHHHYLEYLNKDTQQTNVNPSGVMFNGKYNLLHSSTPGCDNKHFSTNNREKFNINTNNIGGHINTDSNFDQKSQDYVEGGSNSNRLPVNAIANYEQINTYNNNFYNDMKYNGPKKDEFSSKLSKNRDKSKDRTSDVHFNFNTKTQSHYVVGADNTCSIANKPYETKNRTDKGYSRLATASSPKANISQYTNNFIEAGKGHYKETNMNTYAVTYKERMKNVEIQTKGSKPSFNVQNLSSSNTFTKQKK